MLGRRGYWALIAAAITCCCAASPALAEDITPPTTTIVGEPDVRTNVVYVHWTTAERLSAQECRIDGKPWISCAQGSYPDYYKPYGISSWERPNSGFHTIEFRATDLAGNREAEPVGVTFYLGPKFFRVLDGPDVRWTPQGPFTADTTPTWLLRSDDPRVTSFRCGLEWSPEWPDRSTGTPGPCWDEFTAPEPLEDGWHTVGVQAVDEWGFTTAVEDTEYGGVFVDSSPPQVELIAPGRVLVGSKPKIRIKAYDTYMDERTCTLDGVEIECAPQKLTDLARGVHVIRVYARDLAGTIRRAKATFKVSRS